MPHSLPIIDLPLTGIRLGSTTLFIAAVVSSFATGENGGEICSLLELRHDPHLSFLWLLGLLSSTIFVVFLETAVRFEDDEAAG